VSVARQWLCCEAQRLPPTPNGARGACRSIQKHDWEPLLTFLEDKKVRVLNLDQARQGPGVAAALPLDKMAEAGLDDDEDEADDDFGGKVRLADSARSSELLQLRSAGVQMARVRTCAAHKCCHWRWC
jgi:hypothetical protein